MRTNSINNGGQSPFPGVHDFGMYRLGTTIFDRPHDVSRRVRHNLPPRETIISSQTPRRQNFNLGAARIIHIIFIIHYVLYSFATLQIKLLTTILTNMKCSLNNNINENVFCAYLFIYEYTHTCSN